MESMIIYAQLCLFIAGDEFKNCDQATLELKFDRSNVQASEVCKMGRALLSMSRNIYARPGYRWMTQKAECL